MSGKEEEVPQELKAAVDGIFAPDPPENLSDDSMRELDDWVRSTLLPTYGREIDTSRMWCTRWFEHAEAVARLWALYLAWGNMHDPQSTDPHTGPIVWQKEYLDYTMDRLRAQDGPFGGCMSRPERPAEGSPQHTIQLVPACDPWPDPKSEGSGGGP